MTDEGEFTNAHRDAIIKQKAEKAISRGIGEDGRTLTREEILLAGAMSKGQQVIMMKTEAEELYKKLGIQDLPETVEDIKSKPFSEPYSGGN